MISVEWVACAIWENANARRQRSRTTRSNIAEGLAFLNRKGVTPDQATGLGLDAKVSALIPGAQKSLVGKGEGEGGIRLGGGAPLSPIGRPNRRQTALAGNRRRQGR